MLRSCPFFSQCFCECRSLCSLVCSRSSLPTNAARLSSREVRIASHAKTTPPCVMLCYVAVSLVALACLCFFLGLAPLDSMQPDSSSAVYIIRLCLMCMATPVFCSLSSAERASRPTDRLTAVACNPLLTYLAAIKCAAPRQVIYVFARSSHSNPTQKEEICSWEIIEVCGIAAMISCQHLLTIERPVRDRPDRT